jgi:hypothetical protein
VTGEASAGRQGARHVLTYRSVQLLDVSAAGLLLADPRGELRVVTR